MLRIKQDLDEQNAKQKPSIDQSWLISVKTTGKKIKIQNRRVSTITILIKSNEKVYKQVSKEITLGGKKIRVEKYFKNGPDTVYTNQVKLEYMKN